jgi:diguanylate cyclase (GGDEF)-like protein
VSRLQRPVKRPAELAWFITGPLAFVAVVATVVLALSPARDDPHALNGWLFGPLFVGLFVAAKSFSLEFELRRQTFSVNLVEIPLLLGLVFLPPVTLIAVSVLSSLLVQYWRRFPLVKLFFNVSSSGVSTALAAVIFYAYGHRGSSTPETWLILVVAVGANVLATLAAVVGVITLVQGRISSQELNRTAVPAVVVSLINITIGLVVLVLVRQSPWSALLLAALVAFFVFAYRSYAQAVRQHRTLTEIYELTRAVADTPHDGTLADVLLGRVRALLQAEFATLWLPAQGRYPEVLLSARFDDRGLMDVAGTPDTLRRRAVKTGETVAVGAKFGDAQLRSELQEWGTKDAIVVPLRAGSAVIGCLEVAGRLSDRTNFGAGDVRLLQAVAAHAAVAVENSRLVDRLRFDAYHDTLTSLPNRRRISAALEESIKVRAPGEVVAVLQFDVDGLREVNDSLGYASGDKLLAEVARRLRSFAPPAALVGRAGGDEFVVTLRAPSADAAVELATELRHQLQDPMVFDTLTLDVDTAVGVVVHPDHGTDSATLLQRADVASQSAKNLADGVQLFNLALESRSVRRLGLAGDLRRALDDEQLEIYFQPKVALRDRRLVGVECLARWEHPAHGSVAPEDFVAVAEHTGQLSRLTEVVLREGLRHCRQWADASRPLSVSVNLSARTLVDPDFPDRVAELLEEYGVPPERLTFEIAENGVVGGLDRPMPILHRLHDLGVRLAVDDFGTGSSSLSYLRRLPVDEVKIDRSFIQGMATDPGDLAIVRAVVDLSRHFGLTAVAEGVESELTLGLLEEIGCDIGQGFLFSRPLPFERLEAWFGAQTETEPTPMGEVRRLRAVQ